jgi:membrane AbrB-like protein
VNLLAGLPPRTVAATFALGAAGAGAGWLLHLPLPMLLGPLLTVAGASMAGVRLFGHAPAVPQKWRYVLVPVVGVAIGAAVPPDILDQVGRWWITVLALLAFVPVAHALAYGVYRRLGGIDRPTAYFAAMPGGFIEALEMGERAGARMDMLVALQFLRLALCIVGVPIAFALVTGQAVGSGTVEAPGHDVPLTAYDAALLIAAGAGGWALAARLHLPAAVLSGPLIASALLHGFGLTGATSPDWAVALTQWAMGTSLGARFSAFTRSALWLALRLAALNVVLALALAAGIALALAGPVGEPAPAVILAFAPGGISEMSLVALSLQLSIVFVTLHHLLRIVLAVVVARAGLRLVGLTS